MADAKQIFDALMVEALSDIRSAKLLLDGTEFSRSIYHSQQAVEKAMKASLVLAGIVITDDHWVSDRFMQSGAGCRRCLQESNSYFKSYKTVLKGEAQNFIYRFTIK